MEKECSHATQEHANVEQKNVQLGRALFGSVCWAGGGEFQERHLRNECNTTNTGRLEHGVTA